MEEIMSEEQKRVQDAFAPGWLKRVAESLSRDTQHWPEWRRSTQTIERPESSSSSS